MPGERKEPKRKKQPRQQLRLSIIIPYYNAEPYTSQLLDVLAPQMRDDVEVIVVDDGSKEPFKTDYKFVKVIHKDNGGCATARNVGIDKAEGEYISFIDADDLVARNFIEKVLEKTKDEPDVIDLSWKSLDGQGTQHDHKLLRDDDWLTNPSVCTRVFKRSFIGDIRFNEQKDSTEDEDFSRKVGFLDREGNFKHMVLSDYMYFYRTSVPNSKIKRFKMGLMKTKRIVYYIQHVTKDMTMLLEEIKKDDEQNEVWLLTEQCDIPELKRYCQIHRPFKIWAHEAKGDVPCDYIELVRMPIKAQIVIYCEFAAKVGGITTFIYNFCKTMRQYYDIIFVYREIDTLQLRKILKLVRCIQYNSAINIVCDTLILNRLTDEIYSNIIHKKSVQIIHCCRQMSLRIPSGRDVYVNVSQAAKDSWGDECKDSVVIRNPADNVKDSTLFLVSATRVGAGDKGDNDSRMIKLANMLNDKGIPFLWLNFSSGQIKNPPKGFYNMPAIPDVKRVIKSADYLVQLSDVEAYSYAILEALTNNTPVLATPFDSLFEQGFIDGKTGYLIPKDMDFDVTKITKVPKFDYDYEPENLNIIGQWFSVLGIPNPTKGFYDYKEVTVKVLSGYTDMELKRWVDAGEVLIMTKDRAAYIMDQLGNIEIEG